MRHIHAAELRDSWTAWVGVSLAFIVTNFTIALSALVVLAAVREISAGRILIDHSAAYTINGVQNIVFCAVVAAAIIGASTSLVVDSRRGSLARLALAGAMPRQVVATVMSQLLVVTLACAVIGDLLAYAALRPTLNFLGAERGEGAAPPGAVYAIWPAVMANLLAVLVALLGGWKQARRASRIPPVEALREATGGSDRMTVARWVGAGFVLLLIVAAFAAIIPITANRNKETISNLIQVSMVLLILVGALLALLAPVIVGPVTRVWTSLVPRFDPSWELSRQTTVVKGARLSKSVVPVMMTIGLLLGMMALGDAMNSSLAANGVGVKLEHVGFETFLVLLGLPLLIAISGGVGSLITMSKQRDAELALSGIVGTTPAQRLAMPIMEGVIITITGALLAALMVLTSIVSLAIGFPMADFTFAMNPSFTVFAGGLVFTMLVTVAATLLPTVPSLRKPEPKVIARLVAE